MPPPTQLIEQFQNEFGAVNEMQEFGDFSEPDQMSQRSFVEQPTYVKPETSD
jgi:hypothetical protein